MLSKEKLVIMLTLQNKMNSIVNPSWLVAGYNWMLAGALEIAEAIDHHGWKWWKKQTPNMQMFQNELVDYIHFVLSEVYVRTQGDIAAAIEYIIQDARPVSERIAGITLLGKLQYLLSASAAGQTSINLLHSCMHSADMSWDDMFEQYIAKNALNIFRQKHGYKDGSYVKTWYDGAEDNVHMLAIMRTCTLPLSDLDQYMQAIDLELGHRYARTLAAK